MLRVFGHCRRLSAKTPALMQLMELLVHSSSSIAYRDYVLYFMSHPDG